MDTNIAKLALGRVIKEQIKPGDIREAVQPGNYLIDTEISLHLVGNLKIGEDSMYTPTTSIPWKETLALFVRHCGITREAALNTLQKAMTEALAEDTSAEDLLASMADLKDAETKVQKTLEKLPKQIKKGAITGKLEVQDLQVIPVQE
jgi:hypothetical protein